MDHTHSNMLVEGQRPKGVVVAEELLGQCHQLLSELEEFQNFLTERRKEQVVDIRQFQNSIRSELKSLERVCELSSSCNIPVNQSLAFERRSYSRTNSSYASLFESPILHRRLGCSKSQHGPSDFQ